LIFGYILFFTTMALNYFSSQAAAYARFRPSYPLELYEHVFSQIKVFESAWDCGTGNGQVAIELAKHFKTVKASDISSEQLQNAIPRPNIEYVCCAAEKSGFPANFFDLITVGTALHWFDLPSFWKEVKRVGKKDGVLAVWFYNLLRTNPEIDAVTDHFCYHILGEFWPTERKYLDKN